MQHFITDSNWSYRKVIDTAAIQTSKSLPKVKLTGFIVDETGVEKKGDKSVGVGHQYCGNVGKTANSQVAVMGCLSNGDLLQWLMRDCTCPKTGAMILRGVRKQGFLKKNGLVEIIILIVTLILLLNLNQKPRTYIRLRVI
jgi:SRSO17 transposase